MTKGDFMQKVSSRAGVSQADTQKVISALIEEATEILAAGDEVSLSPFGKFKPIERAARTTRNPRTGQTIQVPVRKSVRFVVSSVLHRALVGES